MNPTSRQIFITGATSGIGAGIACAFAALGDSVLVTGATEAEVKRATDDLAFAGIIRRGAEHDPVAFAEVIDINLAGTMRVCSAARAGLRRGAAASSTPRRC